MACTTYPAPSLGLFINADQGVWSDTNQTKGSSKSASYSGGTLTVNGPTGSTGPISPGLNQKVRHKFFGGGDFLAVLTSDTGVGPKSHRVSIVDFTATPPQVKLLFTTPIDNNPPLPFVQYDSGPGSACCIGGAGGGQIFGLGVYRSDTGEVLDAVGGGYTPNGQVLGEAVVAGVQVKDGGNIIAGPAPLPQGELDITPTSASFTSVTIGGCPQAPSTKTFTLKNTGEDCLTLSAIAASGPFSITATSQPLPVSLKKNESITATVTFAPTVVGSFNNVDLAVTRSPALGDDKLRCSGQAVAAVAAYGAQPPSPANFGHVLVSSHSSKTFTFTNTGTMTLALSVAGSAPSAVFRWVGLNAVLGCGQQATVIVEFWPTVDGAAPNGQLVAVGTPGGTKTITLTGEGCIPNAVINTPPAPFPGFGQVRQGYRMPRFIEVQNTGDDVLGFTATLSGPDAAMFGLMRPSLSITDVLASQAYAVPPVFNCAGGPTGTGKQLVGVVFHANVAPPKMAQATLTLHGHNDASAPASFTYALNAEVIAGNVVDVVAVFDHSGSMADPVPGGGNKMGAAIQAGRLLAKLIPPDASNRLAFTRFDDTADTFQAITVVSGGNQNTLTNALKDPPLTPDGSTAIAAGAMVGAKEFATPHPTGPQANLTKAMIVLTDGKDNTAYLNPDDNLYYSLTGVPSWRPTAPFVQVPTLPYAPPSDVNVYAIGLGTGQDIDIAQLAALSSGAGGYYGAVDPTQPALEYQLMKFYTQIYMDLVDTSVLKDPRDTILPGTQHVIDFDVLQGDVSATVVVYDFQGLRLPFWLESPQGEIVDAAFVPAGFSLRAGFTETTRFLDVVLPWADPKRYAGRWKLILVHDGRVCRGNPNVKENKDLGFLPGRCIKTKNPVDYGYMIGVGSNFRLQAFLSGGTVQVGEPIRMTGVPTEAGLPVLGCAVTVDVVAPNGHAWAGINLHDDGAHDDGDADDGEYARNFLHTAQAGSYTFTFRAKGFTRDGEAVHREVVRSKMVQGKGTGRPDGGAGTPGGGGGHGSDDECCARLLKLAERQTALLKALVDAAKKK